MKKYFYGVRIIFFASSNKLFAFKIIILDDRGYHGNRSPTHFAKTRMNLMDESNSTWYQSNRNKYTNKYSKLYFKNTICCLQNL